MKKNLILGTAIDYDWEKVKIFVKSIRAHSDCEIYFLVNNFNRHTKKKFDIYKIKLIYCNLRPYEFRYRYIYFFNFLKKNGNNYKNIFFTDVRDVFFQSNPFKNKIKNINFFEEEEIVKNCQINSLWIKSSLGNRKYKKFKNRYIICSGTVMGRTNFMIKYFKLMARRVKKLRMKFSIFEFMLVKKIKYGLDQPACHDIVYSNIFKKQKIFKNKYSYIATVGHMKNFLFDKLCRLKNKNNLIYSVVHQYDRFQDKFVNYVKTYH
jgi:hypothetical protein